MTFHPVPVLRGEPTRFGTVYVTPYWSAGIHVPGGPVHQMAPRSATASAQKVLLGAVEATGAGADTTGVGVPTTGAVVVRAPTTGAVVARVPVETLVVGGTTTVGVDTAGAAVGVVAVLGTVVVPRAAARVAGDEEPLALTTATPMPTAEAASTARPANLILRRDCSNVVNFFPSM
jgi:hypothetical protein